MITTPCSIRLAALHITTVLLLYASTVLGGAEPLLDAARESIAAATDRFAFPDQAVALQARLSILESRSNLEIGLNRARSIEDPFYASLALGGIAAVELPSDRNVSGTLLREALERSTTIARWSGDHATSLPFLFELVPYYATRQAHDLLEACETTFNTWQGDESQKGPSLLALAKASTAITPAMASHLLFDVALTSNHYWEAIEYLGTAMARQWPEHALKMTEEAYEAKKHWPNEQYFLRSVLIEMARTDFPRAFEGIKKMRDLDREIAAVKLAESLLAADRKREAHEVVDYVQSLESEFNWTQQALEQLQNRLKTGRKASATTDIVTPDRIDDFLQAPNAEAWQSLPWVKRIIFRDEKQVRDFMATALRLTESNQDAKPRYLESPRSVVFGLLTICSAMLGDTDQALEFSNQVEPPALRADYLLDAHQHAHPMPAVVSGWPIRFWRRAEVSIQDGPKNYLQTYRAGDVAIEAGFAPEATEIILGQPLFITFGVTAASEKPCRFMVGGDIRGSVRHNNFHITAADAEGQEVRDPYSYNNFGGPCQSIELASGQSYDEKLFLGHWCAFDKPGRYIVTCRRTLEDIGTEPRNEPIPVASRFELTIVPYDAQRMTDVIAQWGRRLHGGAQDDLYEASLALAAITDKRVIEHLACSLTQGDFRNKLPAIQGLAQFSTNAAADALLAALKDPDHVVRDAGAAAMRKTGRLDRALETLLPELQDESPTVRATAAQALGTTKAKDAYDALLKATHDPEPPVRHAAAIALGTLGYEDAVAPLEAYLNDDDMGMRVAAAKGLHVLGRPLQPQWLTPVIRATTSVNDQNFHEAIRLIRMYCGAEAAPALIECLKFDDPSPRNAYNMYLILAIHHSPGGPECYYDFFCDLNTDGTPEQIEGNRRILARLQQWAKDKRGQKP